MDADRQARAAITARVMMEIRIAWKIGCQAGEGLWFPETDKLRHDLEMAADGLCQWYGSGTHWIERRVA